jgi:V8-like Glu-specific endopeptidase
MSSSATLIASDIQNGHSPVSNQPESGPAITETLQAAPSLGSSESSNELTAAGGEGGFAHAEFAEGEAANVFTPPQSDELRDIGEASFGTPPPQNEDVIGVDNRNRVPNTTLFPWRAMCSLLITAADNSTWVGTGWFVSARTLITAGHCVYIKGSNVAGRDGWVKSVQVMPGRNGDSLPYGSVTSTTFRAVSGWMNNGDPSFDYGAIIIPTPLGTTVGWLGVGVYTDDDLRTVIGNISGYPNDKMGAEKGTQWYDGQRVADLTNRRIFYEIDTFGGQSGAAVYRASGDQRFAFAIHAYGGSKSNSGTRITPEVYNNISSWKA